MNDSLEKIRALDLGKNLVLICSLILSVHAQDEYLRMTLYVRRQTDINGGTAFYQCYSTGSGYDTTFEFGRTAPIPSDLAPDPPPAVLHSRHRDGNPWVVTFSGSSWATDGFGAFYCNGYTDELKSTKISAFFTRNDAKFTPSDGVFTRTVSVGDPAVLINMTQVHDPDLTGSDIGWRKDGGGVIHNGSLQYTTSDPVQTSDGGIYEIYYSNERSSGRGALYRLIVRDCSSGKWGPPDCYGICDKCYNGGVCDDKTGRCICPNNLKGPNCLTVCRSSGGNRFGIECEYRGTYSGADPPDACRGVLFCLPDPLGCTCDVGYQGLTCITPCINGAYGAGCTETCHCQTGCDPYTGCNGGCDADWSGLTCQIPDTCDTGYYGSECTDKCHCLNDEPCDKTTGECSHQECAAGYEVHDGQVNCGDCQGTFFGLDCALSCYCHESACDKVTGYCSGPCLSLWAPPECRIGISNVTTYAEVNPYQPSDYTCIVQAVPGYPVPEVSDVYFYRYVNEDGSLNNTGITNVSSIVQEDEISVVFLVDSVAPGKYTCTLLDPPIASLDVNASIFVLLLLPHPPITAAITNGTIDLHWHAWNADGNGIGDPPLVGYTIYQSMLLTGQSEEKKVGPEVTYVTLNDLHPNTDYQLSVAAVRAGPGGTGPRSPTTVCDTLCGRPSGAPSDILATAEEPNELILTWSNPPISAAECRSGFTKHTIYYSSSDVTFPEIVIDNGEATSYTVRGLDTYTPYTFYMTSSNKDEKGETSALYGTKTMEETAPSPANVGLVGTSADSIHIKWSAATPENLNGVIHNYDVRYQAVTGEPGGNRTSHVMDTALEVEYVLTGLKSITNYSITVRVVNGAGSGEWSKTVYTSTQGESGVEPSNTFDVLPWILFGVSLLLNICVCVGLVFARHRRFFSIWQGSGAEESYTKRKLEETVLDLNDVEM